MVAALKKLSETELFTIPDEKEQFATQIPPDSGVYSIYDKNNNLQFIGISRSIGASILSHRKSVTDLSHSVKVRQAPEKKKKPNLRLTLGRHVQLTVPLEELIERLVKENKVVALIKGSRSAPLCGFSQKVVGILESQGLEFETIVVLDEEYNFGLRPL